MKRYRVTGQAAGSSHTDPYHVTGMRDVWSITVEAKSNDAAQREAKRSIEYRKYWTDRLIVEQL